MSMKRVLGCIKKADRDYNLIEENDIIGVGISGGKDSLVLLEALNIYKRFAGKKFEVIGIHVKMGFPNMDLSPVVEYFKNKDMRLEVFDNDIYSILKQHPTSKGQLPCSICSRMKKAAVNQAAKSLNCNKVAFAHHAEDAIETLLMNAIYGGRVATFSPRMHLDNIDIDFIRPLVYARENWISMAAKKLEIPVVVSTCPNDKHTQREEMKKMLKDLYRKYPSAKDNFLLMLHNDSKFDLWHPIKNEEE
ncbi:MAG: tRNA 2-thiocytidine(32) synthetase TtcA [Erysipelotrichaceae bacterium]|nr:tRNA 2-thiocytidine(32) synthetase TtcA [Erysipelotrichaceae bacterium]